MSIFEQPAAENPSAMTEEAPHAALVESLESRTLMSATGMDSGTPPPATSSSPAIVMGSVFSADRGGTNRLSE